MAKSMTVGKRENEKKRRVSGFSWLVSFLLSV